jgi:hypothetical protein
MEMCKTCGLPYKLYKPYMGEMCACGGDHSELNEALIRKHSEVITATSSEVGDSTEVQENAPTTPVDPTLIEALRHSLCL